MEEFNQRKLEETKNSCDTISTNVRFLMNVESDSLPKQPKPKKKRRTKAQMEEFRRKLEERKVDLFKEDQITKEMKNISRPNFVFLTDSNAKAFLSEKGDSIRIKESEHASTELKKPQVLRKFRPPMSRSKIRELAQTKELNKESVNQSDAWPAGTKNLQNDEVSNLIFKFKLVNAWLASKNSSWTAKNSNCLQKMLNYNALISTYKCMGEFCSYHTTSEENFDNHLNCHKESHELQRFWLNCPYCFFIGDSSENLLRHYRNNHQHDKYQCSNCFYRSVSLSSCWEHSKTHHESKEFRILECPLESAPKIICTHVRLIQKRQQFVPFLPCSSK
jgi:hypothetical protein